jgi:NTE family protein
MERPGTPKVALVLSGGGARAAYQAGVLHGISRILDGRRGPQPFSVITGLSAGAINASFLAAARTSFADQANRLQELWGSLLPEQVIQTGPVSLTRLALSWLKDLSSGGALGNPRSTHLLDTTPLRKLLGGQIDFDQIRRNLASGVFHGLAVTATSYATGTSVTFFDSPSQSESWLRSSRIGIQVPLTLDHVLASSSIPVFFRPVRIGQSYYGDGGIRSNTPFSPAIHLGADRIVAIGARYPRSGVEALELNREVAMDSIALADIAGVALNSLFLDALEFDYERLQRINETVQLLTEEAREKHPSRLKVIPTLLIRPSEDLGLEASDEFRRFPAMLRFLLRGLGASPEKGADLLSYLAFDRNYTRKLVALGVRDAEAQRAEIQEFFA